MIAPREPRAGMTPAQRAVIDRDRAGDADPGPRAIPDRVIASIQGALGRAHRGGLAAAVGRRMARLAGGPSTIRMRRGIR